MATGTDSADETLLPVEFDTAAWPSPAEERTGVTFREYLGAYLIVILSKLKTTDSVPSVSVSSAGGKQLPKLSKRI